MIIFQFFLLYITVLNKLFIQQYGKCDILTLNIKKNKNKKKDKILTMSQKQKLMKNHIFYKIKFWNFKLFLEV